MLISPSVGLTLYAALFVTAFAEGGCVGFPVNTRGFQSIVPLHCRQDHQFTADEARHHIQDLYLPVTTDSSAVGAPVRGL